MTKPDLQIEGFSIYIVRCKDNSYHTGMCRDMDKKFKEINNRMDSYFTNRPHLVPVTLIYHEEHVPFREAYAKHRYLKYAARRYREKLIRTGKWPVGKNFKNYIAKYG